MSDDLEKERDFWVYCATFWMQVAQMSAARNVIEGLEEGPDSVILKTVVKSYIFTGLENGFFDNGDSQDEEDGEYDRLLEDDEKIPRMPWSVVVQTARDAEVDALEVLQDYIDHAQSGLQRALGLAGFEMKPHSAPTFAGIPITAAMFHEIANGEFGPEFERQMADKYILHVMHGPNPCQHPYESLDMAIEGAAIDLERGIISEISHITHDGLVILAKDELVRRVNEIMNAGNN